ncbi:amidohydrolase family protein [Streptomyces sp. NBC_01808]|uniref:amidohydrolase family protein n=1 Tax=Streptomyces sp. NBC_01808 TaxID=2975947 RepID=UPI002DD9AEFD|nr:amidohydrolase family protein [Streptomyces sp. NBC_01808]WSA36021.1 amidohydrolase family protein [Streptomyces sp. NBC_01808]
MSEPWRVDAHHHVWDLSARRHDWLDSPALAPIRRDFGLADLAPATLAAGVDRTVVVQSLPEPDETAELLALAAAPGPVTGVVGWVDLTAPDVPARLAELRRLPGGDRLVGIRHPVQSEADPGWLTRPDVLRGLRAVGAAGLAYDLLVRPRQLPAALEAVRACPEVTFVLDHLGQPPAADGEFTAWARHLGRLAAGERVFCKLSGLVTGAGRGAGTVAGLRPYAETAWEAFGAARVMFGSDWPVCLLAASYAEVAEVADRLCEGLSYGERTEVFRGTARRAYRLSF